MLAACTTATIPGAATPASTTGTGGTGTAGTTPAGGAAGTTAVLSDAQVAAAVARLDELTKKAMADTGLPGLSIAVVHGDKLIYAKGFGVKQVGTWISWMRTRCSRWRRCRSRWAPPPWPPP